VSAGEESEASMATQTIDTSGMNCPIPIIKAKKAIKTMDAGSTLEVISTDPGSVRDFEAFSRATGNELLESLEEAGVFRFVIQKG
tara:strand:+ start:188 stop:442 length:255 start_codon:yes stop_codon:yes gene_type:complete